MNNVNDKINQLIQLTDQLTDQENNQDKARVSISKVDEIIAQPSIKYLLEPYENGFWEARSPWNALSYFSRYLLNNTRTLADMEKEADFQQTSTTSLYRRLSEEKRKELLQITSLSAALHIFDILAREKFGHTPNNNSSKYNWLPRISMDDLREKFSAAAKIYEEQIYFEGIRPRIRLNDPFQISGGLAYILERPAENGVFHVIAPRRQDLQAVVDFFHALGSTPHTILQRVFAPDDSLFKPYFSVLSAIFPHVIRDEQISRSFAQALEYYEKDDFQHCISTLGLIAEGYLQRIYSSLLREENANGLTLGQIIDRIHKKIGELTNPPKATSRSIDGAYEMIKKIDDATKIEDIKPLLREIVQLIQDSRNTLGKRIDDITKINTRSSPFPGQVIENLTELLKWRNAASHNSRVPLAAHEADRTLYCLVRVITWWQEQLSKLDWSKTKIEILEELILAAK